MWLGAVVLIVTLWLVSRRDKNAAQQKTAPHASPRASGKTPRKRGVVDWIITGGLTVFLMLVLRVGWWQAILRMQYILYAAFPFLREIISKNNPHSSSGASSSDTAGFAAAMTRAEAIKILGVEENCTEIEMQRAYKNLMMKLHPDQGGNGYLASKLNEARDCLLQPQGMKPR
jgi:hypothetical protein